MGLLRLFLAISVIITHTKPLFGLELMRGDMAVTLFFIISGFYMSMVMASKYDGSNRTLFFYSNRALRLYPAYVIALLVTAIVFIAAEFQPGAPEKGALVTEIHKRISGGQGELGIASILVMIVPNLVIFGSDLVYLFHHTIAGGWTFTWGVLPPTPDAVRGGGYLLIGPAWSIGVELWFYLLVPLIARARTWMIVLLAVLSLVLRLSMESWHEWSTYFVFPAALCFFLYGMLAHRFWASSFFKSISREKVWIFALGGMLLLMVREFIPGYRNYPGPVYLVMAVSLPFIFEAFKGLPWDRWIGNLSYPVYLLHIAVLSAVHNYTGGLSPVLIVGGTLALSVAVNFLVEEPLERYRQRRAARHFSANFTDVVQTEPGLGGAHKR